MARHWPKVVISVILGGISFWIARLLHLQPLVSLLIGIVVTTTALISAVLDFIKKPLELWKLKLEISKLRREDKEARKAEEEEAKLVRLATPEEISKFGVSYRERAVRAHVRAQEEKEVIEAKKFIVGEEEK